MTKYIKQGFLFDQFKQSLEKEGVDINKLAKGGTSKLVEHAETQGKLGGLTAHDRCHHGDFTKCGLVNEDDYQDATSIELNNHRPSFK